MNVKALLAVSLLANAVLGYVAFKPAPAQPVAPPPPDAPKGRSALVSKAAVKVVEQQVTNTVVKRFNWQSVESPDYKEYIANLRSVGCPDETIRDIIIADVNKLYDAKKKQVRSTGKKFEYWKGGNPMAMVMGDSETAAKIKALDDEKNSVLKALGIEPDYKMTAAQMMNPLDNMLDFLPEEKKSAMVKLLTDMQNKMAKAMEGGGRPDPEDIGKAMKEMDAAIKKVLTPEEALNYDLRMSMTANMMRMQTSGWDPGEQEFLDIFKLRKSFDDEFNPMFRGNESEDERKKRETAEKQLKDQIRQTLGPDRYKEYELSQDSGFQATVQNLKKADLGVTEAKMAYDMKKLAEEQANKLRKDTTLNTEERNAALQAIQEQTTTSMKSALGDKGWEAYNRGYNGQWLKNLAPKPASTSN